MKTKALEMIDNLQNWLQNINSIATHPYSAGVNVVKMLEDLGAFVEDLKGTIRSIEEVEIKEDEAKND